MKCENVYNVAPIILKINECECSFISPPLSKSREEIIGEINSGGPREEWRESVTIEFFKGGGMTHHLDGGKINQRWSEEEFKESIINALMKWEGARAGSRGVMQ